MVVPSNIESLCPCLKDGPYAEPARRLISVAHSVGPNALWAMQLMQTVYDLCFHFRKMEQDRPQDPETLFNQHLNNAAHVLDARKAAMAPIHYPHPVLDDDSTETITSEHYGTLFSDFGSYHYYEEPADLLRQRLERNGFDLTWLKGKSVLDAGCGNGRYSYGIHQLGAGKVIGLDRSRKNISDAKKRLADRPVPHLDYTLGNVLDLNFENDSFDMVISNGVLHHTEDIDKGLRELVRVMRPGGRGFLMLINNPGGIHWDLIEICRVLLKDVPYNMAHAAFTLLQVPANLRFFYLDHILVPINIRLTAEDIVARLEKAGASSIRRANQGADIDGLSKFNGYVGATAMWGVGLHRFFFSKSSGRVA